MEIPLIENVDIKEKNWKWNFLFIARNIKFSLKYWYIRLCRNDVIEEASLLGVGMIDDSWGGASNMDSSTVYQVGATHWYFKPTQYLAVEGQSDVGIFASGEMWGRYAGRGVIEVLSGIDVTTTNVGGFTIKDMGKVYCFRPKNIILFKKKETCKSDGNDISL